MAVLFVTPVVSDNSLGRTYSLWRLTQYLGWQGDVIGLTGNSLWAGARGTAFADRIATFSDTREMRQRGRDIVSGYDAVIAIKPLPESFGIAREICEGTRVPLILDIDDPDIEVRRTGLSGPSRLLKRARNFRFERELDHCISAMHEFPHIVSNPTLQDWHGGVVIPHARSIPFRGNAHITSHPEVAFVGRALPHKGLSLLREAVRAVAPDGFTLLATAPAPPNPQPWETWLGADSFVSPERVAAADIVVLPSMPSRNAHGQLPMKLVDAMLLGRGIGVSRIDPLPWAIGDGGLVFEPGSVDSAVEVLKELASPKLRSVLGARARSRALAQFSVPALAPLFEQTLRSLVSQDL